MSAPAPVPVRTIVAALVAADLVFVVGTALAPSGLLGYTLTLHLDLRRESNLAAWYSSASLLVAGLIAAGIAHGNPTAASRGARRPLAWWTLAAALVALSADEAAMIHEMAGEVFTARFGRVKGLTDEGANAGFAWVFVYLPGIVVFAVWAARHYWTGFGEAPKARWLALAGLVCWVGVVVAEPIESRLAAGSIAREVEADIEEGLELSGTTLLIAALLAIEAARRREEVAAP